MRFALTPVVTARDHDGSVLVPLAVADPHLSVPTPVGIVTDLVTARGLVRGIGGPDVRIAGNMGGIVQPCMFTVILDPV